MISRRALPVKSSSLAEMNFRQFSIIVLIVLPLVTEQSKDNDLELEISQVASRGERVDDSLDGAIIATRETRVEYVRHVFLELKSLFRNIWRILDLNVPLISRDIEKLLSKLINHLESSFDLVVETPKNSSDTIVHEVFTNIEKQLQTAREKFETLANNIDEFFEEVVMKLNETLINNTAELDWWAEEVKQQLRSLNDMRLYKEGCKIVDDFIQSRIGQLQNCCNISIKPMRSLCRSGGAILADAIDVILDMIDRMQACLEDKNSYIDYLIPCISIVYDDMNAFITRALHIRHQIKTVMPMKILFSRSCVAVVLMNMKQDQNAVESRLFPNKGSSLRTSKSSH